MTDKMSKSWKHTDEIGSIELLEVFGDDLTAVNAARVSMAKHSDELTDADKKLIKYLAKHNHTSPFFHQQIRFRIKMPIFVAREWYRHTVGFARNEVSRRYVDSPPEFYMPNTLRERNKSVKQGSKDTAILESDEFLQYITTYNEQAAKFYQQLLDKQVAPEIARMVLPQSMYTEFIETASLFAYARLCSLRNASDAQKEIRDYAAAIADMMESAFPISWSALTETEKKD